MQDFWSKVVFSAWILGKPPLFDPFFLLKYLLDGPKRGEGKDARQRGKDDAAHHE